MFQLDSNAIAFNLLTRTRKTEVGKLPPIESLFQFRNQMPVTLPVAPAVANSVYIPTPTSYYIPQVCICHLFNGSLFYRYQTVHPSWLGTPPFAPIVNVFPAPQPPSVPSTYQFSFPSLALPSLAPLQPAVPQGAPLLPSPDVTAILETELVKESRRHTGIKRHIRVSGNKLVNLPLFTFREQFARRSCRSFVKRICFSPERRLRRTSCKDN